MRKLLLVLLPLFLFAGGMSATAQDRQPSCDNYCSSDVLYTRGAYDERASSCSYTSRSSCDYGCNSSYTGCAEAPAREIIVDEEPVVEPEEEPTVARPVEPIVEPYEEPTVGPVVEDDWIDYEHLYEDTDEDSRDTDSTNTTAEEDDRVVEDVVDYVDDTRYDERVVEDVVEDTRYDEDIETRDDVVEEDDSSIIDEYLDWLRRDDADDRDEDFVFSEPLSEDDDSGDRDENFETRTLSTEEDTHDDDRDDDTDDDTEDEHSDDNDEDGNNGERTDDKPVVVVPPTTDGGKRATYTTEDGEEEVEVRFSAINLLIDVDNIVVETSSGIIVTPNKLDALIKNKAATGENVTDVEVVIKEDGDDEDDKDDVGLVVTSTVPVKLFWVFDASLPTVTEMNASDLKVTKVRTPWWRIFTKKALTGINIATFTCSDWTDCIIFNDGNACTGQYTCEQKTNTCKIDEESIYMCSSYYDTQCVKSQCVQGSNGSCEDVALPNGTLCDDDYWWTDNDACQSGQCVGKVTTECATSADCEALEDGNLCTGTLYCKSETKTCTVNPATVVKCGSGGDTVCTKNSCNPDTGVCSQQNLPEKTLCDDGYKFTKDDVCSAGVCKSGEFTGQCTKNADCGAFEDGNTCNGTLYCNLASAQCVLNPSTKVYCPSVNDTSCSQNTCNPNSGVCSAQPVKQGEQCDDGDV
ncbi:MAG TPA: hypothetical protein QF873_03670, partial [Patescibacteria group bacterium]|nr:hypothetical protein [Patescibacteria group bacterium]